MDYPVPYIGDSPLIQCSNHCKTKNFVSAHDEFIDIQCDARGDRSPVHSQNATLETE